VPAIGTDYGVTFALPKSLYGFVDLKGGEVGSIRARRRTAKAACFR
jgi:hypothetical protein